MRVRLRPGEEFNPADLPQAKGEKRIKVRTIANGIVTGGISYELDPRLERAVKEYPE